MHLDGARLWEVVFSGACTLREIGECFDSIQLCLTKGLGAPIGSVVSGAMPSSSEHGGFARCSVVAYALAV